MNKKTSASPDRFGDIVAVIIVAILIVGMYLIQTKGH